MNRLPLAQKFLQAGIILFCISLPVSLPLNNVAIGLIVAASLIEGNFASRFQRAKKTWLVVPLLFFGLHLLGLLYSRNIPYGLGVLETKAAFFLFPLALGTSQMLSVETIRSTLKLMVLANLAIALACLGIAAWKWFSSGDAATWYYYQLTEPIDLHPVYFAWYLSVGVLASVYFQTIDRPLFSKRVTLGIVFFTLIYVVLLTALVAMVVLPVLLFWLYLGGVGPGRKQTILVAAIATFLAVGITAMSLPYTRNKISRATQLSYNLSDPDYQWGSLSIRLAKWECSWAVVREHCITGVGTGDAQDALMESYRERGFSEGLRNNYNAHNQYLQTWMMIGLPGFACLVALVWPFRRDRLWQVAMLLTATSLFTENILDRQKGVVFFVFVYTLLAGPIFLMTQDHAQPRNP